MLKLIIILIFFHITCLTSFAADIVLDPGHSPSKPGAISCTGEKEYKYNDSLVNSINSKLIQKGLSTSITRTPAQNKSLIERVKDTRDKRVFISVHHDAVQPQFLESSAKYPLSYKDSGYSIFVSKKNKFYDESVKYATRIARELYARGFRPSQHHGEKIKGENRKAIDKKLGIYEYDDLVVLKKADCPAVLVEAGVIVHPDDEKLVKTASFKNAFSNAMANALK